MANTTADKLAKLNATKADLKAALAEKGQTVGDVFSTYPAAVRAIESGAKIETVSGEIYAGGNQPIDLTVFFMTEDNIMSETVSSYGESQKNISVLKNSIISWDQSGPVSLSGEVEFLDSFATNAAKVYGPFSISRE